MPFHLAWFALHERAHLQRGETLLVHAAAGGTGSGALQIGKALGAKVIATAGSDEKLDVCRDLGADVVINYCTQDFANAVNDATYGHGVDIAWDTIGGDTTVETFRCMAMPAALGRRACQNSCVLEDRPDTRYAQTPQGDSIAYQVCGRGDTDLVFIPNWASPIDLIWEHPTTARFLTRLASFTRLILFDKRGSGSSDNVSLEALATLEDWTEDVVTAMDAVGSARAVMLGAMQGGPIALLFAASRPDRTAGLVLVNAMARRLADVDYPGVAPEQVDDVVSRLRTRWGTEYLVDLFAPSMAKDDEFRRWFARFCRVGNPPTMAAAVYHAQLLSDVRASLPLIHTPTLVVQRADADGVSLAPQGRYLGEHIAGARYVELPGEDSLPYVGDVDPMLDAIEEFVTGDRAGASLDDRVLSTVLFTDIVASTEHAARLGDRKWAELLDEHDRLVAEVLARYRGRKINPTGDGMLATFDGPARAVRCAQAICTVVSSLGIQVRAGLHTGEIELRGDDIGGMAVHIGQRVSARAEPGQVLVTRTVTDLVVGSGLEFEDRGDHELRGIPGSWRLLAVRT